MPKAKTESEVKQPVNLKSLIRNLAIFLILIAVVFWLLFKDENLPEIAEKIRSVNPLFLLCGVAAMFGFFLTESWNIKSILKPLKDHLPLFKGLKFTFISFFFSAITPASSGGQPMEVYYMRREGYPAPHSALAVMIHLCGIEIATLTMGLICAAFNPGTVKGPFLMLFIFGITIHIVGLTIMLTCIFSGKVAKKIVRAFFKFLRLIRLKKLAAKEDIAIEAVEEYSRSATFIRHHKSTFVGAVLRGFLQMSFYYLVPYFVYRAFGLTGYSFIQIFTTQAILYCTISGIPLPGSVGVSEQVFLTLFGPIFTEELLSGAMLLARGINFYGFVILAAGVIIYNVVKLKLAERTG